MHVVDLADEHLDLFCLCLEDWSDEAKEAGGDRREWVERFRERGLRAKLALDDDGEVGGMVQYLPIEQSWAAGSGLYLILCIWVHGHPQGRGDFQGRGMGSALLEAAEADARALGAHGMAAWGLALPIWMKASWFRSRGYRRADRSGISMLLWKPFDAAAEPPGWHPPAPLPAAASPGKVDVTVFTHGWCMAANLATERMRRAAAGFGDRVSYREIDTSDPAGSAAWGRTDEILIDGKRVRTGPPPSYESLRAKVAARVRRG